MKLPYYEIDFSFTQLDDAEELEYYKREQQKKIDELKAYRVPHRHFRMGFNG